MTATTLYIAMSKRPDEAEFKAVTFPVERGAAVRAIKQQWLLCKLARLVPAPPQEPMREP